MVPGSGWCGEALIFIDLASGDPPPKRGDIVQTNVGDRRERTWLVLKSRKISSSRYSVWMARWWELEMDLRLALYVSAERNGGQRVILFTRYSARKRKKTFEELMGNVSGRRHG